MPYYPYINIAIVHVQVILCIYIYIYRSYTDRISSKRNISNHANVRQKPAEIIALPLKKSQQTNKHGTETTFQPSRQFIVSNRFILKDLYNTTWKTKSTVLIDGDGGRDINTFEKNMDSSFIGFLVHNNSNVCGSNPIFPINHQLNPIISLIIPCLSFLNHMKPIWSHIKWWGSIINSILWF